MASLESLGLADVDRALDAEFESTKVEIESWPVDPCVLLLQLVRFLDRNEIGRMLSSRPLEISDSRDDLLFRLGFNPALELLIGKIPREPGFPLAQATNETIHYSGTVLHHFGRIRLLKRYLSLACSGALIASRSGSRLQFNRPNGAAGVEIFELLDHAWLDSNSEMSTPIITSEVQSEMQSLVYRWQQHFIGYDASPNIDDHFMRVAIEEFDRQRDLYGIHPKFRFGAITGTEMATVSALLSSIYLKHVFFCIEYLKKYPDGRPDNLLTIWDEKKKMTDSIYSFAKVLQDHRPPGTEAIYKLTRSKVYQCLSALSITKEAASFHCQGFRSPIPALIEVRRNFWMRPVAAVIDGPLAFGTRELRRRFPRDWDKNIRKREAWFRNDLYALFAGNRYLCLNREIQISANGRTLTDIDAVVLDTVAGRLALFELKWQEPLGFEERERRSRARILRRELTKWIETISTFIRDCGQMALLVQLGIPEQVTSKIRGIAIFGLARHNARFSGFPINHPDIAVASWRQFLRARWEMGALDDTFSKMFMRLKQEEIREVKMKTASIDFPIAGYDIEADHFLVMDDPVDESRQANS